LSKFVRNIKNFKKEISDQEVQEEFNAILKNGLKRKLNVFEENYIQYYKNEVNKLSNKNNEDYELNKIMEIKGGI
jgi:uncharacterized membrane-anchored protein